MDITYLIVGIVLIAFFVVGKIVFPNIRMKLTAQQIAILKGIAETVVYAAEKLFGAKMGEDKKAYALELAKQWLAEKGLVFDDKIVNAAIEAQVQQLNLEQTNK